MTAKIFIDGEAGTTGLQIRERLAGRRDLELLSIPEARRKDAGARAEFLNAADVALLCLPDAAAREAVSLLQGESTRIIDASTAHRVADGWTYGFPEMEPGHETEVAGARFVANPGCYPQGAIAIVRPLVARGLLPADYPVAVHAVSGYSGGGKSLIARYESEAADHAPPYYLYGLSLRHKHLPEMERYGLLARPPIFVPSVGRFAQGMLVQLGLHLSDLNGQPSVAGLQAVLAEWYAGRRYVEVMPLAGGDQAITELEPEALNGTNLLRLHVFASEDGRRALLVAQLDNLGKGASGAAVQNLNLMLGLEESAGLELRQAA